MDLVFDYAGCCIDSETLMTEFDPQWRKRYHSDFEVFQDSDGYLSIRRKANVRIDE
jgi:hypothetical protein